MNFDRVARIGLGSCFLNRQPPSKRFHVGSNPTAITKCASGVRKEASAACQVGFSGFKPTNPQLTVVAFARRSNGETGQHGCNPGPIVAHEGDSPEASNADIRRSGSTPEPTKKNEI